MKAVMKRIMATFLAVAMLCVYLPELHADAAEKTYSTTDYFARSTSIKGMQGSDTSYKFGGLQHTMGNLFLEDVIYAPDSGQGVKYEFEGETFYFAYNPLGDAQWYVSAAKRYNMTVSVVFLIRYDNSNDFIIDANSRQPGHPYYAPNPDLNTYGGRALKAYWHYLMEYLIKNDLHIDNFILGNEVNMPNHWHYSGTLDVGTVVSKYSAAFNTMHTAIRKYSDIPRCSISLDHSWQHNDEGRGIMAKTFLDTFAAYMTAFGIDDWCVSTHLYPAVLFETDLWNGSSLVGYDLSPSHSGAAFVDGSNLWVMTNYIRDTYGPEHRVMLTEQGFTDHKGSAAQNACLAYTYYAAMYDPMVDCFLIVDGNHNAGSETRLNFTISGKTAGEIYTKIDNGNAEDEQWIANTCLPTIGVSSWASIIPNWGTFKRTRTGFFIENGLGCLFKESQIDTSYTGWYTNDNKKYLLVEGVEKKLPTAYQLTEDYNGWYTDGTNMYWMDNGVMAKDKEVFDPLTNGWYWFDADGTMAINKDAFVPTNPERTEGKWVRYDENGVMAKGANLYNGNWYRFDVVTGEMIKGLFTDGDGKCYYYDETFGTLVTAHGAYIGADGLTYHFDETTGECLGLAHEDWIVENGNAYWYENGIRQGYDPEDPSYRGKEIYDPASGAWYWLDNVDQGKKAVSKDVYQESEAGKWGDIIGEDGKTKYGKWVRYDAEGHMIKGWAEQNGQKYYFDPIYGTMAKGTAEIDGVTYEFDQQFGYLIQ